jgi:hypothetical protein
MKAFSYIRDIDSETHGVFNFHSKPHELSVFIPDTYIRKISSILKSTGNWRSVSKMEMDRHSLGVLLDGISTTFVNAQLRTLDMRFVAHANGVHVRWTFSQPACLYAYDLIENDLDECHGVRMYLAA